MVKTILWETSLDFIYIYQKKMFVVLLFLWHLSVLDHS